jgi:hypothetical protein
MIESQWVAICCFKERDVTPRRCTECRPEYGCLGFLSTLEVLHFNELIPASMLGAPLPLNLWPNLWKSIEPDAVPIAIEGDPTPVQLLVATLGLKYPSAPDPGTPDVERP